jgi:hypothetical protein
MSQADIGGIPKEIFKEAGIELNERVLNFFEAAAKNSIDFDHGSWINSITTIYFSKMVERSLRDHADALNRTAKASEKYTRQLAFATWALVFATIVLAIITAIAV